MGTARFRSAVALICASCLWTACNAPKPPAAQATMAENQLIVTPKAMAGFIKVYFAEQSKNGNGFMTIHDATTGTDVQLKLKPIEAAEVSSLGMGISYSCIPMEDATGAVWDVDFMSQKTNRGVDFTEVGIHKTPTGTHYEWQKNDRGVWEKQPN